MGKKQHSKDRMFITKTEWATEWGGAKSKESAAPFKRLPFYCCSFVPTNSTLGLFRMLLLFLFLILASDCVLSPRRITFTPFEDPVCTADGFVFDVL